MGWLKAKDQPIKETLFRIADALDIDVKH